MRPSLLEKAINAGKHVYCEKPIATNLDEALKICRLAEAKGVKNRLHIDVNPVGCDRDEEVERLIGLGARRTDIGQGEQTWVVMADPEGNEFCILRALTPEELAEDAAAAGS